MLAGRLEEVEPHFACLGMRSADPDINLQRNRVAVEIEAQDRDPFLPSSSGPARPDTVAETRERLRPVNWRPSITVTKGILVFGCSVPVSSRTGKLSACPV